MEVHTLGIEEEMIEIGKNVQTAAFTLKKLSTTSKNTKIGISTQK